MHKTLMILRREYLESVRKKMFWIGTLGFPFLMVALFGLSIGAQLLNPESQKTFAVLDPSGVLADPLADRLAENELGDGRAEFVLEIIPVDESVATMRTELEPRVTGGELDGILVLADDPAASEGHTLYRKSVGDEGTARTIRRALQDAVVEHRLQTSDLGVKREVLDELTAYVDVESYQVLEGGETKKKGFAEAMIGTFVFVIILFMTLYMYGFTVARSIIQEKSTRVIEVLLGSVTTDQLMAGKILGIGLVGLTQIGVYVVTGMAIRIAALSYFVKGDMTALLDILAPLTLLSFLVFFVLGYFMYTSLFAMIGAVCNTEQDAQSLMFPVMMSLMIPYLLTFFFVRHPDSTASVAASMFPLFTPMVMFMRISVLTPPWWQIALSIVLVLLTIWVLFKAAGKVFRVGTLMYGKRPTLREIWRWARS